MKNKSNTISITGDEDATTLAKKIIEGGEIIFISYIISLTTPKLNSLGSTVREEYLNYYIGKCDIDSMKAFVDDGVDGYFFKEKRKLRKQGRDISKLLVRNKVYKILLKIYDLDKELFNKIKERYNEKYEREKYNLTTYKLEYLLERTGCLGIIVFILFVLFI